MKKECADFAERTDSRYGMWAGGMRAKEGGWSNGKRPA